MTGVDSTVVSFNNTGASPLMVYFSGIGETVGNGLIALSDDTTGLEMVFSIPQTSLSLDFGNDQAGYANPGDLAVLTLFQGATQVAQFTVAMNCNDLMDQSIAGLFGAGFDRATFFYTNSSLDPIALTECVDNITFAPTPGAAALLGLGGLALGRRRR